MGKVFDNNFTRGVRGKVGHDMVFRRYKGETILCVKPVRTALPTEKQLAVQQRFREASLYAKSALADPVLGADYVAAAETARQSAHVLALTDYLTSPTVIEIVTKGYTGKVGDKIAVKAMDDFKVVGVDVTILDAANAVVETGAAVPTANGITWDYTAKTVLAATAGATIRATATDKPGNSGTLDKKM